jgi:hypothetical protein
MTPMTRTFRAAQVMVTAALLAVCIPPVASAQQGGDARWHPWIGCWAPQQASMLGGVTPPQLCVVPTGGAAADFITIADGKVVDRTAVDASGTRRSVTKDGCSGWEQASFSKDGDRVYVRSEMSCGADNTRSTSAIIAMTGQSTMLQLQGLASGEYSGVRAARYNPTAAPTGLPEEAVAALQVNRAGAATSRLLATRPFTIEAVKEAVKAVEGPVVEAFLTERKQRFNLDAKTLIELADAKIPERITDLMVALSYPKVFAVNAAGEADFIPENAPGTRGERRYEGRAAIDAYYGWERYYGMGLYPFGYSPYGYSPYSYYGYGYGYGGYGLAGFGPYSGFYYGRTPVGIVRNDGGAASTAPHGRVVKGGGYTQGTSGTGSAGAPRTQSSPSGSGTGSSAGASAGSSAGSSAGASSGASAGSAPRTAQPRTPDGKTPGTP